jgi:hypothetical protein
MTKINIKLTSEQIQAIGAAVAAPKPTPKRKYTRTGLTLAQYLSLIGWNPDNGTRTHLGHMLNRLARSQGVKTGKKGANTVYPVTLLRDFVKD